MKTTTTTTTTKKKKKKRSDLGCTVLGAVGWFQAVSPQPESSIARLSSWRRSRDDRSTAEPESQHQTAKVQQGFNDSEIGRRRTHMFWGAARHALFVSVCLHHVLYASILYASIAYCNGPNINKNLKKKKTFLVQAGTCSCIQQGHSSTKCSSASDLTVATGLHCSGFCELVSFTVTEPHAQNLRSLTCVYVLYSISFSVARWSKPIWGSARCTICWQHKEKIKLWKTLINTSTATFRTINPSMFLHTWIRIPVRMNFWRHFLIRPWSDRVVIAFSCCAIKSSVQPYQESHGLPSEVFELSLLEGRSLRASCRFFPTSFFAYALRVNHNGRCWSGPRFGQYGFGRGILVRRA